MDLSLAMIVSPVFRASVSAHLEHELSAQMASLAHLVRGCGFRQWIDLDLRHAHGAALDQRYDAFEMRAVAPDFGTQRNHVLTRRDRGRRSGADERGASAGAQDGERAIHHVAAD